MTIFELVFIPVPGLSHLVSTVEAAKLLLARDRRLSITVLIITTSTTDQPTATYLSSAGPTAGLRFTNLPSPDRPPSPDSGFFHFIESHAAGVREFLSGQISNPPTPNSRPAGLIVDMFCTNFIDIASELGLPSYVFFTSGACALGVFTHLAGLKFDQKIDLTQFKDSSLELPISCFSCPVPAKILPAAFLQPDPLSATFLTFFRRVSDSKGVMVNTFLELEPFAIRALQSDSGLPKVYPVGPILNPAGSPEGREVVEWLDRQPEKSVVFLCFGTMGGFRREQAAEIAAGLEASGARFLWSLRKPGPEINTPPVPTEYTDFREVLPEGFLERTEKIGKVIGWAPQVAVLGHLAVGGFISHCGWNSVLESLWYGVPVAAFPQYAEQQVNAFLLVRELGLAEAVRIDYSTDFRGERLPEIVAAPEIEAAVRRLMGGGGVVREKVKEMKMKSREAMEKSGSAYEAQKSFIEDVISNVGG
ncbi:UDP-sugar:glycosyltransferase [Striga asiatica]|uniref:Glycosyltransferase n=1 Tax=Striga asiatica TaxID=4170 RepID=A0A5A7PLQ6_STRAF|nr:UDP-sugar:glycosyltransferase [Striga asiatica]